MTIAGERKYRVTVWDHLMQAPVGDTFGDRRTKGAIKEVMEPLLRTKPILACITDGWSGAAALVADELGGFHYWCMFHMVCNLSHSSPLLAEKDYSRFNHPAEAGVFSLLFYNG